MGLLDRLRGNNSGVRFPDRGWHPTNREMAPQYRQNAAVEGLAADARLISSEGERMSGNTTLSWLDRIAAGGHLINAAGELNMAVDEERHPDHVFDPYGHEGDDETQHEYGGGIAW